MGIRKEIKQIHEDIAGIKEVLTPSVIEKARKYDEMKDLCKNIELNIEKAKYSLDDNGNRVLEIKYDLPTVLIKFDENDKVIKNEIFYSINMLDLVKTEDLKKLYKFFPK